MTHIEVLATVDLEDVVALLRADAKRLSDHVDEWFSRHGDCQYIRVRGREVLRLEEAADLLESLADRNRG